MEMMSESDGESEVVASSAEEMLETEATGQAAEDVAEAHETADAEEAEQAATESDSVPAGPETGEDAEARAAEIEEAVEAQGESPSAVMIEEGPPEQPEPASDEQPAETLAAEAADEPVEAGEVGSEEEMINDAEVALEAPPDEAVELVEEEAAEAEPIVIEEPDDDRQWYVVHCYSGYENKVRHNLEQRIETMNMKAKIFDVVVPTEEEMEVKNGRRRTVERRVFPGYILVQMIMDEDSWYVVRNTPGVTGFVGMGNEPTPLRQEEVAQIVKRMEAEAPRIKVTYSIGQKVRIIDGPFNDFIGTVDNIDMDRAKVRVMVSFFGRETPVELDFLQVEKA